MIHGHASASRRLTLLLLAVLMVVLSGGVLGAGTAAAEPAPAPPAPNANKLPQGMPNELKPVIAGTDEFKSRWFTGACAGKGGDFGGYLAAMFPVEPELLFWSKSEKDRDGYIMLQYTADKFTGDLDPKFADAGEAIRRIKAGQFRPTADNGYLFPGYPTTRRSEYPGGGGPVCAADLQRWTQKSVSAWGFKWAEQPDAESKRRMTTGASDEVKGRIDQPCKGSDNPDAVNYCMHAYFVNCDQSSDAADKAKCMEWNIGVGRLFAGTDNWIDQNTNFAARARDVLSGIGKNLLTLAGGPALEGWKWLWQQSVGPLKDFFDNARELPEKWANYFKKSAVDMTRSVLPGLASVGEFDLTQRWFLKWYAMSVGLGLGVMCVMFLLATVRAAKSGGGGALLRDTMGYLPTAIALMLYTPMIAWMLQALAHGFTTAIVGLMGTDMDSVVSNVSSMLGAMTNQTMVGGVLAAIVGFGFLLIGVFALFLGLLMHQVGIPLACVAAAIGYGMFVHPTWRRKALRVPLMLMSLLLSTPLLFLALAVVLQIVNSAAEDSTGGGDERVKSLGALALCALAFFVVGLAPFSLLKWSPLLPNQEDADRMGDSGAGAGAVAGGMGGGMGSAVRASHGAQETSNGSTGGAVNAAHAAHHTVGGSPGGGGAHSMSHAGGGGGGKALRVASLAGGPVASTAARLSSAAGKGAHAVADVAKSGAGAGARAGAISAANRAHGVASNSAPTQNT